jgi:hypothetical protein
MKFAKEFGKRVEKMISSAVFEFLEMQRRSETAVQGRDAIARARRDSVSERAAVDGGNRAPWLIGGTCFSIVAFLR